MSKGQKLIAARQEISSLRLENRELELQVSMLRRRLARHEPEFAGGWCLSLVCARIRGWFSRRKGGRS